MALYILHSIFHLARLSYVRPESFGPYYVCQHEEFGCTLYVLGKSFPTVVQQRLLRSRFEILPAVLTLTKKAIDLTLKTKAVIFLQNVANGTP